MASLRIQLPGKPATLYQLYKHVTTLGAGVDCDIVIPDPLLGDAFASIHHDERDFFIQTLGKRDEVLVNGKKRKKHRLAHQDRVVLGTAEVIFSLFDEPAAVAHAPTRERGPDLAGYQQLVDFSAQLLEHYDLPALLAALMDAVIGITNADKGFLILMEGGRPDVKVARNLKRENIADAIQHLSDAIIAKVVQTRKPLIISDAMHDHEFASSASVMHLRLTSVMCVPLLDRGTLLGLIYVGNDSVANLFQEDRLQVLTVFAAQASLLIRNALLVNELRLDNRLLHEQLEQLAFGQTVGSCPAMLEVFRKVVKVAPAEINVLITGETGTGKELIARELHVRSGRAKGPFVSLNCGAIPENLLESELFGHVKGAFTGAVAHKAGRFHAAHKGTLFLDEIGEMPLALQVKILRAIQDRAVVRVGDTRPEQVDIRIVAATNRDLEAEIKAGRFREDLYYRLNVVNIHLPPLRERGDDILTIARHFLARYGPELGDRIRGFSPNCIVAMRKYRWPGNVRELENRIRKGLVLAEKTFLGPEDLGLRDEDIPTVLPLAEAKERFARDYINEVLALNNGNRTKTARDLAVDPRTVFRHLEKEGAQGAQGADDPDMDVALGDRPGEPKRA